MRNQASIVKAAGKKETFEEADVEAIAHEKYWV